MTQTSNIPVIALNGLHSQNKFHIDGSNQHYEDCLRYLDIIVEDFPDVPKSPRKGLELIQWIKGFNFCYERI